MSETEGEGEASSCIMCKEVDNEFMVQCDTCDEWCHFDCAGVSDEIKDLSWNCVNCNKSREVKSADQIESPAMTSYGTPPEIPIDPNAMDMHQHSGGQPNHILMSSHVAATAQTGSSGLNLMSQYRASTACQRSTGISPTYPRDTTTSAGHVSTSVAPMYPLATTTNTSCFNRTLPETTTIPGLFDNNNSNMYYGNRQAAACRNTETNANVFSNLNSATMFPQRLQQNVYTHNQYNRTHVNAANQLTNSLPDMQKALELEMLDEQRKLKEHYLIKKYEILQQFAGSKNNMEQNNFEGKNINEVYYNQQNNLFNTPENIPGLNAEYYTQPNNSFNISANTPSPQQLAARQALPRELPTFHGDPEEWPIFINSFRNSTAVGGYSKTENLIRLQQCLKGKAREIVRNKLMLPEMVPETMRTLEMYFGRPDIILERVIDKARQMPPPRDKLDALIDFAMSVRNICATIEACKMYDHLNNPMLVKELLEKLSNSYKMQWAMQLKPAGVPTLKLFSDWLYSLADAASQVTTINYTKRSNIVNTHTEISTKPELKCFACNNTGHKLSNCSVFARLSTEKKWHIIRQKHVCRTCLNVHRRKCNLNEECGIEGCRAKHHPLLHNSNASLAQSSCVANVNSHCERDNTTLFRIIPVRLQAGSKIVDTYAFLDEGSSITLVEEETFNLLGAHGKKEKLCLQWTSETTRLEENSFITSFNISSPQNKSMYKLQGVRTVKNLSLPNQTLDVATLKKKYPYLSAIPISSYTNAKPTILIGSDNWSIAVAQKVCEGPWNQPIATKTRLGWAVQGGYRNNAQGYPVNVHLCECEQKLNEIHEAVKQMYVLEASPVRTIQSLEDERAIRILESTCTYVDGRFEIGFPWRNENVELPDSYNTAYKRSICLQKRMSKDVALKNNVEKEINNLINKGYAKKLTSCEIATRNPTDWYLPIFVTSNPNKPNRIRMVWDAAAKTNGLSLNDFLISGPDLLTSLNDVLLGFRTGRIAICGDISEMFHQILIKEDDSQAQRFLWWNEDDVDAPSVYKMNALTFGLNCAPCMAHFVRNKNAERFESKYPRAVKAIIDHHYVDDLIDSVDDEDDAIQLAEQVGQIHASGGFIIRNWASNSSAVLDRVCGSEYSMQHPRELGSTEKVLGVRWDPVKDVFKFAYAFPRLQRNILDEPITPTKREILKVLMSIYDPLGFVSCYTVGLKILLQEIWRSGINWDDELTTELAKKWQQWKENIKLITQLEIPRCYSPRLKSADNIQLHTFVDAGELGYAAVSFLRIQHEDNISVMIVMAKSKVAPLKPMSIPRLELQAAVLGVRLAQKICSNKRIPINSCHWWSDSKTVLQWLRMDPRKLQQYVMHRVAEIQEASNVRQWRWIPSKMNPADFATKVTTKMEIEMWIHGPEILLAEEDKWPDCDDIGTTHVEEIRSHVLNVHVSKHTPLNIEYFSDWKRLYRALATFLLYLAILRAKLHKTDIPKEVTFEMLCHARTILYRNAQSDVYAAEISCLKLGKNIAKDSSLKNLDVFLDHDGLVKIRSRIEHLSCSADAIVLPKNHDVTHLVVKNAHENYHHLSHETVINSLRGKYYIPRLRVVYRKIRHKCQKCKNEFAKPKIPQMAPLPPSRLGVFERPFTYTGIDYFGPMTVTVGRRSEKRWGVIFTCLTTRAIHIEVAHSLDTGSCIMCLRNFIGRRGYPRQIHTDNGTNFKATEKMLREQLHEIDEAKIAKEFDEIKWIFNPPAAPHMGGAWERLVRSVKTILHSAQPKMNFSDESLRSALIEVEFIVNSRPLTFVSLETKDDEAITPNHLLLGSATGYKPICTENFNLKQRWHQTQAFADQFWRRWVKEYSPIITRRAKWFSKQPPITPGNVVLIVDENMPRNCWLKGIVTEAILAKDGQVRQAVVRTQNGTLRRPASKLAVLDVGARNSKLGEVSPAYGGGNVAAERLATAVDRLA